ncbi:AI-2E family transporter [Flavobacterium sp. XGLA_31]|uniref:AI-2E family transporter n=1 Tax=Flavobacterium sp. XGLA_31 TaxID=3447666 RepID=UPI003F3D30B1
MTEIVKLPFFIRLAAILVCLMGLFVIVYFGQDIIFPLMLSLLFAIILRPVVAFLNKKLRFPYFIAVVFAITLFVLIFLGIFYFISLQVTNMASDWDKIKDNLYYHYEHLQNLIKDNFNLSRKEQNEILDSAKIDSIKTGKQIVGSTLSSFTDVVLNLTLIPIYTFLFLLYQNLFINFLIKLYKPEHHQKLREILVQIKVAVQSYVVGLLFEMVAVSVLTTLGLYLIGVQYFILLGIITGILNMIPYIGILFAGALTIVVSLTGSTDLSVIIGVIIVNIIVQFIDNNVLVPLFVNSKVQINALVSIVGIIIGNVLGGITGMFLAIPIIAIFKVIFDRIDALEPWGYVLGDDLPKTFEWHKIRIPSYNYDNSTSTINFSNEIPKSEESENSTTNDSTV